VKEGQTNARLEAPEGNRLSGLRIDPFSSGADAPLPGMGTPNSSGCMLHSALDELGSSMLRDLLDSPSPFEKRDTLRTSRGSWPLGASTFAPTIAAPPAHCNQTWGETPVDSRVPAASFGMEEPASRTALLGRNAPMTCFGSPPTASNAAACAPWWQSGGNVCLGSLPLPSGSGGLPLQNGAMAASPAMRPIPGCSPPIGPAATPSWGGFGGTPPFVSLSPPGASLPAAQYSGQQRRGEEDGGWAA